MKTPCPPDIEAKMNLWRHGFNVLPQEYIKWHKTLAELQLDDLSESYIIHNKYMADDGWADGMKFLHIIVEDRKTGRLAKWKWSDSQQWYEDKGHGWSLVSLKEKS